MNINHLEEKIAKLPEDHPDRIYWENFIAEQYEKLSKGLFERASIYEMDEDLDYSKMYISIYHNHEIYTDSLGVCSTIKSVVEDTALYHSKREKFLGNSFDYDIVEINISEEKAIAAANAWRHSILPIINFKVKIEHIEIEHGFYNKIVNILHDSPFDEAGFTYSCPYTLE